VAAISILLPNLNNRPFINERLETILEQTFPDWELLVADGYSEDGSWEIIRDFAAREPRMRIRQAPREGIYAALNLLAADARGECVYIAMGDDTMAPRCLEKMLAALERNQDCDICHCNLLFIDERGEPVTSEPVYEKQGVSLYFGDLLQKPHRRIAPHDAALYCMVGSVYISFTQLLLRRDLLRRAGPFPTRWKQRGDFAWNMRAAALANTVHVPEALATWRIHPQSASVQGWDEVDLYRSLARMVRANIPFLKKAAPEVFGRIPSRELEYVYRVKHHNKHLRYMGAGSKLAKAAAAFRLAALAPRVLWGAARGANGPSIPLDEIAFARRAMKKWRLEGNIEMTGAVP